jgi:O-antigen/teichoic acid export membrane protein
MAKQATTSKRLVHNTLYNVAMLMANAVIAFLLIRFFLGRLGEARYGVWVLIGSVFRYRMVLGMGLNSAINRRIPMYLAKDDEQGVQSVISTALLFFSIIAVVLVLLSVLLYFKIGDWFAIEPDLVPVARRLVLIVGLGFAASTPLQLTTAVLSGLQRFDIISLVTLVVMTVRTMLLVLLLVRGYGLLTLGYVYGISEIVARAVQYSYARRLLPAISLAWKSVNRVLLKEMLFYGMNTFLYATGALIVYRASETIIGIFLGTTEVAQFSVAAAGVLLLSQFVQAFTAAVKPAVTDLDARDDQVKVRQIAFLTQKYSLLLLVPAAMFLAVMGREFLTVWVGAKFDPALIGYLATVLAILTAGHGLMLAQHSNFLVLAGRGEHKVFGVLTAVEAVLCIVGAVFSIKVAGWGLAGIAWSNFVPMALVAGVVLPVYFNRKMGISTRDSITHVWWPALLGSVPGVAVVIAWKHLAPPDSWLELFGVILATGAATCVFGWFLSLQDAERRMFLHVVGRGT